MKKDSAGLMELKIIGLFNLKFLSYEQFSKRKQLLAFNIYC